MATVLGTAVADYRWQKSVVGQPLGWKIKVFTNSKHQGAHNSGPVAGKDWIVLIRKNKPAGKQGRVSGWFWTPFSNITTGAGIIVAFGSNQWVRHIRGSRGKYRAYGDGILVGSGSTKAAHTIGWARLTTTVALPAEAKDSTNWAGGEGPPPLESEYEEEGVLTLDENEDPVVDASGEPVFEVPPTLSLRFTSSVFYGGGGVVTYSYTLENLTGEDRGFSFPEITTTAYPAGWTGTVPATGTVTVSVTDTAADDVMEHNVAGQTWKTSDPIIDSTTTLRAYVPTSRVATSVDVTVLSALYDPLRAANVITIQVTEAVEGAVLYRHTGTAEDDVELVAEIIGPLTPGVPLEMEDASFPAGQNTYSVMTGTGVNGAHSSAKVIGNS